MPEGKKKDSFTFSDKIKNSKPAGSKSFANRIFAKIGKDGKPRQTLYERTRRDAPFFIAAVIALLLLPFLYKYSGSVGDDNEISPITGDLMQDPDSRDGYYSFVDSGNSALAPYPGNDTALLLVKPYAGEDSEAITEEQVPDVYTSSYDSSEKRDGYADVSAQKKASKLRDKETNILNEYRKRAAATTRKAFKRTPTKINALGSAGLRRPGGSKLGVNMWGGGLKKAADKVKGGPTEGPKPVSLQPLTAAGKPSRSSFGQGALAAAQKSKDAMSKSNPIEALRDAQFRPLDNHRFGGMDFDRNPYGPGGSGQLKRDFNYSGKEPWWWDMMKTRMQKQWERMFDYKWGWIDWGTDLLRHWLGGLLNCLVTGNEDGDMGTMFGSGGGSGDKKSTCCGKNIDEISVGGKDLVEYKKTHPEGSEKHFCKLYRDERGCSPGYKAGRSYATAGTGWWATRKSCFGIAGKGTAYVDFEEKSMCNVFNQTNGHYFMVNPEGEARDWNTYIYVIAKNQMPKALEPYAKLITGSENSKDLCVWDRYSISTSGHRANYGAGAFLGEDESMDGKAAGNRRNSLLGGGRSRTVPGKSGRSGYSDDWAGNTKKQDEWSDSCVIAITHGTEFSYDAMVTNITSAFEELLTDVDARSKVKDFSALKGIKGGDRLLTPEGRHEIAKEAFSQLVLKRIEAVIVKDKLANNSHTLQAKALPMPYGLFVMSYIRHKDVASFPLMSSELLNRKLDRLKLREENKDRLWGNDNNIHGSIGCDWTNRVSVSCTAVDDPTATVAPATLTFVTLNPKQSGYNMGNISVEAQLNIEGEDAANITSAAQPIGSPVTVDTDVISHDVALNFGKFTTTAQEDKPFTGLITWVVKDKDTGVKLDSAQCAFNATASPVKQKVDEGEQKEETPAPKKTALLAPSLSWIPSFYTARNQVEIGQYPQKNSFKSPYLIKGGDEQHCEDNSRLKMDSNKAKAFVRKAVDDYNAKQESKDDHISYDDSDYPSVGEFVDALNIAYNLDSRAQVPKAAVCELGRNMVRMSEDMHVKGDGWHNDLGAFLAYIDDAGILYPTARTFNENNEEICDSRFVSSLRGPLAADQALCDPSKRTAMDSYYHYSNYNRFSGVNPNTKNKIDGSTRYRAYMASLTDVMKKRPLEALVSQKSKWTTSELQADDALKSVQKYNSYDSQKGYAGLIKDRRASKGQGQACEEFFRQDESMNVGDVLDYVQDICQVGLTYKPAGMGNPKSRGISGHTEKGTASDPKMP